MAKSGRKSAKATEKAAAEAIKKDLEDGIAAVSEIIVEPHAFCEGWFGGSFASLGLCPKELKQKPLEGASDVTFVDVAEIPYLTNCASCVPPVRVTGTHTATIVVEEETTTVTDTFTPTSTVTITGTAKNKTVTEAITETKTVTKTSGSTITVQPVTTMNQTWYKNSTITRTHYSTHLIPRPTQNNFCGDACDFADQQVQAITEIPEAVRDGDFGAVFGGAMGLIVLGLLCRVVFVPIFENLFDFFDQFQDWWQGRNPRGRPRSSKRPGRHEGNAGGKPSGGGGDDPNDGPDDGAGGTNGGKGTGNKSSDTVSREQLENFGEQAEVSQQSTPDGSRRGSLTDEDFDGGIENDGASEHITKPKEPEPKTPKPEEPMPKPDSEGVKNNSKTQSPVVRTPKAPAPETPKPDVAEVPKSTQKAIEPKRNQVHSKGTQTYTDQDVATPPHTSSPKEVIFPGSISPPTETIKKPAPTFFQQKTFVPKDNFDVEESIKTVLADLGLSFDDIDDTSKTPGDVLDMSDLGALIPQSTPSTPPKDTKKPGDDTELSEELTEESFATAEQESASNLGNSPGGDDGRQSPTDPSPASPPSDGAKSGSDSNQKNSTSPQTPPDTKNLPVLLSGGATSPKVVKLDDTKPGPTPSNDPTPGPKPSPKTGSINGSSPKPSTPPKSGNVKAITPQKPVIQWEHPTEAQVNTEAQSVFKLLYPTGDVKIVTAGNGLYCGLRAMIISLTAAQTRDPTILVPTLAELLAIVRTNEVYKAIMDGTTDPYSQNTSSFGVDQLINIITIYYRKDKWPRRVIMGVRQDGSFSLKPIYRLYQVDPSREEDLDNLYHKSEVTPIQFFIHFNGYDHYMGISPPERQAYCEKKFPEGKVPGESGYDGQSDTD